MNNYGVKSLLVQKFWDTVKDHADDLFALWDSQEEIRALYNKLVEILKKINEGLVLELGPCDENVCEITISADGIEEAFSDVEAIYYQKPEFDNLVIYKFRQPILNLNELFIKIDDTQVSYSDILFELIEEKSGIIVVLFIPGFQEDVSEYETLKFLILDACLGEYDAVKKVLYCDALNLENYFPKTSKSIAELKQEFDEAYKSKYLKGM
jgi:hypothetical protein